MRLRDGVTAEIADRALSDALQTLGNLRGGGTRIQQYLSWVARTEKSLRAVITEPDMGKDLRSDRYWHLFNSPKQPSALPPQRYNKWVEALYSELEYQFEQFETATQQLKALRAKGSIRGRGVVYDTNSLMHYQPPAMIDWRKVAEPPVRLIVPHVVVDELDKKRYSGTAKMAHRARSAQRALLVVLRDGDGGNPVAVPKRDGVTLEVFVDEAGHYRSESADDEIIERALLLRQLGITDVAVLTHDLGMVLRAKAARLDTLQLPPDCEKPDSPDGDN